MTHEQMGFHLAHGVEEHADHDEHTGAAEEGRDGVGNVPLIVEQQRDNRDDGQKDCPSKSDAAHRVVEIFTGGLTGTNAGDIAAVFLKVVGDLQFVKLGSDPEIGEEQDH